MKKFRLISTFRFRSILLRTVLFLGLFLLFTTGSLYYAIRNIIANNYKQSEYSNTLSLLSKVSDSTNTMIQQLLLQMDKILDHSSTTSLMVAPERQNFQRSLDVSNMIYNFASENELLDNGFLYIYGSEQIFTSAKEVKSKNEWEYAELLDSWLLNENMLDQTLAIEDSSIHLLRYYPNHKPLSVFVLAINKEMFYDRIMGSLVHENPSIFVYTKEGTPVFSEFITYPDPKMLQVTTCDFSQDTKKVYSIEDNPHTSLCLYRDPDTAWYYLHFLETADLSPNLATVLKVIAPFSILLLLGVILLSLYITYAIYLPIENTVTSMIGMKPPEEAKKGNPKTVGNTLDYIKNTFFYTKEQNQSLSHILNEVAPAIMDQLFSSLLEEEPADTSQVERTLAALHSDFSITGHYILLALQAIPADPEGTSDIEQKMYILSLQKMAADYWSNKLSFHILHMKNNLLACILFYPKEEAKVKVKLTLTQYQRMLEQATKDYPFTAVLGQSRLYNHISKLHDAYVDAQADLNYHLYYIGEKETPSPQSNQSDTSYYQSQVRHMLQLSINGNNEEANSLAQILVKSVSHTQDISVYLSINSAILEQMVAARMNIPPLPTPLDNSEEPESENLRLQKWEQFLPVLLSETLAKFSRWGQNNKQNHIENAIQYIKTNYYNSSLSLDSVSQYVGISSSYLSMLFNELLNQNFIDYVRQYRVSQAQQLLKATNYTITEIGYKTGFNSPNNFIRVFKRFTGKTPGVYRNLNDT